MTVWPLPCPTCRLRPGVEDTRNGAIVACVKCSEPRFGAFTRDGAIIRWNDYVRAA